MSTNFNTCFIDSNGRDVSEEFVEKSYLLDVYPSLINQAKAPSLWLWGENNLGELGKNDIINTSSPVQTVSGGTNWKQIKSGYGSVAAIKTDGSLWFWGFNGSGKLGNNSRTNYSSPIQTISAGTNWKQVSTGNGSLANHTAAIKTDGTLWLWGTGTGGELGRGTLDARVAHSSPVQTISAGTNWKQVATGTNLTGAIKTDGTLWMWGFGGNGELGRGALDARISHSSPVQTVSTGTNWKQVSLEGQTVGAVKTDGTLWLWGANAYGVLGTNSAAGQSSPVQTVSGGTNWKQVSVGSGHAAAIKTDGTLWMWGNNANGQIGIISTISQSSPVQTVSGGTNWKQVSVGGYLPYYNTAAIKIDGTLWVWGGGLEGSLGENVLVQRSSPVQTVSGGTNWKQVSMSAFTGVAIREEGDW